MTTYISSSTCSIHKYPSISFTGSFQPALTANIGFITKPVVSTRTSRSKINLVMIVDTSGSETLSPKDLEDELDREIAAMTLEERLVAVRAMAGTWTDLGEETNQGWRFYDWDAPDDIEQISV